MKLKLIDTCDNDGLYGLYPLTIIKSHNEAFEKLIPPQSVLDKSENITHSKLKSAAEKFLYLNSCSFAFKEWILFYKDLLENQTPHQIILTLNRLMKENNDNIADDDSFRRIAEALFKRAEMVLSLNYKKIQNIIALRGEIDGNNFKGKISGFRFNFSNFHAMYLFGL